MATIKGTTLAVQNATIELGDKVIITDNLYEIADINAFYSDSGLKIKLEKTVAATVFTGVVGDLITVLGQVESYTGAVIATGNTAAGDLNTLANLATGVVTATLTSGDVDSALVDSLSNVRTTDKISFTASTTDTAATDIVALKKILPTANFSAILEITGTSDDIAAIKSAANIVKTAAVTIDTGIISAADANAIAKATTGDVTAEVTAGTAAALNKALVDAKSTDLLSLTLTGTTATAADLKALNSKTLVDVDASSIETITGNVSDVKAVLTAVTATEITLGTPAITVSGTISAADANTIAIHASAGVVTANIAPGTANSLNIALGALGGADKLGLTVLNNSDESATEAADLVALNGKTASKIKVDAKEISGTEANLTNIYVTNKADFTGLGNKAVTITDADADADALNAILKATSGVVIASSTDTALALKTALVDAKGTDALTLTLNAGVVAASDLKALDAKTSLNVDASDAGITITGNAADVKTVLAAAGIDTAVDVAVTVTGKTSAADVNTISKATTGEVIAAEVTAGTAATLNKALADVSTDDNDALTLTVTGATAAATDLIGLDSKTSIDVNATAVKTITGSVADITAVVAAVTATTITATADVNATVNGKVLTADLGDLNTLLDDIDGKVTATLDSATAATLAGALTNGALTDALTINVVENKNVGTNVITATDAGDLATLNDQTSVKVKVDATQITGTYAELDAIYVATTKAGFSNLGNEAVTITGAPDSAARVDSILKATTGAVTATVTTAGADVLVANLKNANASDDLTLVVSGEAKASDLNILDGKTSHTIDVGTSNITGNIADVTKVFVTNAANFVSEGDNTVTISGTVTAAQADAIADKTSAVVTATITAGTAEALDTALVDGIANAYTLTVSGTTADVADLSSLNTKTTVDVNAAAIKTVTGDSTDIATLYNGTGVSGLGNEAVTVTNSDALVSEIASINADTTGVINASTVTTTADTAFSLSELGDLSGITGLYHLNTIDTATTVITLSLNDLLAANDSKTNFDFSIVGDATDTVAFTTTGWTQKEVVNNAQYTFTNDVNAQVITVNLTDVTLAV